MARSKSALWAVLPVLLGSGAMVWAERALRPAYLEKSLLKLAIFLGCILLGRLAVGLELGLKRPERKSLRRGAVLAALTFLFILGGYAVLAPWLDLSQVTVRLGEKEGITAAAFPFVALYISLVNSFLEELFFRGFAFLNARRQIGEEGALLLSSLSFALYHVGILDGWAAPGLVWLAVLGLVGAGVLFDLLDREGSILPGWLVHLCANLAINTIGLRLFGIL